MLECGPRASRHARIEGACEGSWHSGDNHQVRGQRPGWTQMSGNVPAGDFSFSCPSAFALTCGAAVSAGARLPAPVGRRMGTFSWDDEMGRRAQPYVPARALPVVRFVIGLEWSTSGHQCFEKQPTDVCQPPIAHCPPHHTRRKQSPPLRNLNQRPHLPPRAQQLPSARLASIPPPPPDPTPLSSP